MKSLKIYLPILAAAVLFAGCKKGKATVPKKVCNIITINASNSEPYDITYTRDKILSIITGDNSKIFEYNDNTMIIHKTLSGSFVSKTTITLNQFGLATNAKTETSIDGTNWNNLQMEYNGKELAKQIITSSFGGAPFVTTVIWVNGNPTSFSSSDGSNITLEYYADKHSQNGDFWNLNQLIEGYFILVPKNVLKSSTSSSGINTNLSYTSDGEGKFNSAVLNFNSVVLNNGPTVITYTLKYQCD